MVDLKQLGHRLKMARVDKALTQHELQDLTGVWQINISGIERGLRKRVAFDTIARLADALGCSLDDLAGRNERMDNSGRAKN